MITKDSSDIGLKTRFGPDWPVQLALLNVHIVTLRSPKYGPTTTGVSARAMAKTNNTQQNDIQLCLAKTKSGAPCQKHPIAGRTRCRLHGGLSTGPKTPEGKAACVAAHWKHGRRSKAYVETRKQLWLELRRVETEMRNQGLI